MSRSRVSIIFCLLLLSPEAVWAHALSPTYYPLGHLPVLLGAEWWPFFVLVPLSIAVETFVLWAWARQVGTLGCLWRAAIFYVVARAAETVALYLLESVPFFRNAGWSSSAVEDFGPLALFLAAGLAVAVPVGLLLYRGSGVKPGVVVAAVCTASMAGYLAAFGCSFLLMLTRGY